MLIFVLRKATLPNRINSVPWRNAVTPTPYHECTQLVWIKVALRSRQTACIMVWSWCDRVHSRYGVSVTAFIHGTELMCLRSFMVRSWCDREHSWYVVGVIPQSDSTWFLCTYTVEIHLEDFFLFVFHQWRKNPPNFIHENTTMTNDLQNRGCPCKKTTNNKIHFMELK